MLILSFDGNFFLNAANCGPKDGKILRPQINEIVSGLEKERKVEHHPHFFRCPCSAYQPANEEILSAVTRDATFLAVYT